MSDIEESPLDRQWALIERCYANGQRLNATVVDYREGDLVVDIGGVRGIVPKSQFIIALDFPVIDAHPISESQLERSKGSTLALRVIELDRTRNHLLLTQLATEETQHLLNQFFEKRPTTARVGEIARGLIVNVTRQAAMVALDGRVYGMLHRSEFAPDDPQKPLSEIVHEHQMIEVLVLDLDKGNAHLSLSYKLRREDLLQKLHVGDVFWGTVVALPAIGAFVDLNGVLGLIPRNQLQEVLDTYITHFKDLLRTDQKVQVGVSDLGGEKPWIMLQIIRI